MTKKDYIAIAKAITNAREFVAGTPLATTDDLVETIICNIADVFASENPKFDRRKFLHACGLVREEG